MSLFSKKANEDFTAQERKTESKSAETLGSRIATARKQHGYTQEEFSRILGVTSQAISKWENDISCPDIMLLPKISQILGVSIDDLLGNASQAQKAEEKSEPNIDKSKLSLKINITGKNRNPVNISLPMVMVKKFTKLGTGIANIVNVGSVSLDNSQMEQIFNLIDEGATGKLLDITDENGQHIVIEIS